MEIDGMGGTEETSELEILPTNLLPPVAGVSLNNFV